MARRPGAKRARLLVLGAGPAQLGLLEAARARGDVDVIGVDRDPAAIGFSRGLVDERAIVSTEDEEGVERLARARGVDGIVSPGADWPVGVAARVAARLGLPHPIDAATAAIATSKLRQREQFLAGGVPHPTEIDPRGGDLDFPLVVKAPDRQGQRGLTRVDRREELDAALAHARESARSGGVLVERLIDGPEVTVNAISRDGAFVPLLVTDRVTAEPPAFGVALAHVWPSRVADDRVVEVARSAVAAVGIAEGPSYTQVRVGPDGPVVMEVAARLGGGHDAELVRAVTGIDLAALAVAFALGETASVDNVLDAIVGTRLEHETGACVRFLVAPKGTLRAIEGVVRAEQLPGIEWVRIYRREGDTIGPLRSGADRAGAILAIGSTRGDALERADGAATLVDFVVDA